MLMSRRGKWLMTNTVMLQRMLSRSLVSMARVGQRALNTSVAARGGDVLVVHR